ncbi:hypothetical protein DFH08DRAFT_889274 [Mycena albidolilacea]|uniref:Uncharacterized protein n=1 Tax=Mycena albidolilacea TaxID=1033008 RepID=A0AAD6ZGM1_9AGAR|nr:hypothetical protein DFH08DRAFT_889274 [Mycena albidolilacea]
MQGDGSWSLVILPSLTYGMVATRPVTESVSKLRLAEGSELDATRHVRREPMGETPALGAGRSSGAISDSGLSVEGMSVEDRDGRDERRRGRETRIQ